jgi:DNA polymerase-3 subunit gamma/tau
MQRARAVVAREASTRSAGASSAVADDSMVSADDEDIEEAVAVGQPVIARVLGGTVIGELDQ